MLDFDAYGLALGARFAALTPPTGLDPIVGSTYRVPNNPPGMPYVVVGLPASSVDATVASGWQNYVVDWDVYFLMDHATDALEVDMERMVKWLPKLVSATYAAMKLGIVDGKLDKAYVTSWKYEVFAYGAVEYHAWHLVVTMWLNDNQALVSA